MNQKFKSHSGKDLDWKIDCDALSDEAIETLAYLVSTRFDFREVCWIPSGGTRLGEALLPYINESSSVTLIVDDVLTTGQSMEEAYWRYALLHKGSVIGIVIFARTNQYPIWIHPIFELGDSWL